MYLKSLTLKGFKSFAKKTTLDFEPGISCVVGPNGSGKSNISDAILWVLGERSAKNIRGDSMQDVIFSGTNNKSRAAMAEVSLCLDNSDGTLNIDYSQVEITRRMYRSGESDYWLNDTPVRRLDVLNILHDSGLGEGTHSIISQGSLDSVLSFDEMQLKSIIEEVAGILKHKNKKIKSIKKLEAMQASFDRINDVTAEIERQLAPLRRRAKKADTYLEIKDDLKQANLEIAVDDYRRAIASKQELTTNINSLESELRSLDEQIISINSEIGKLTEQIQKENDLRGQHSQKYKSYNDKLARLDSIMMMLKSALEQARSDSLRISKEAQVAFVDFAALQQKQTETKDEFENLKTEKANLQVKVEEAEAGLKEINERKDSLDSQIQGARQKRESHVKNANSLREKIAQAHAEMEGKKARLEFLAEKKASVEKSLEATKEKYSQQEAEIKTTQDLLDSLKSSDENAKQVMFSCSEAKKSAEDALSQARVEQDSCEAQLKALERIAATQDISASVSQFVASSANLSESNYLLKNITVEKEFENLTETLLSSFKDAVVVENDSLLDISSEHGESSNFALSLLTKRKAFDANRIEGLDYLIDHIEAKESVSGIVESLLRNVVVCDSFEKCTVLSKQNDSLVYVTKACDIIRPDGSVFLSSKTDEEDAGVLHRARQIEELRCALKNNNDLVYNLTSKVREAASALSDAQAATLDVSQHLAEARAKFDSSNSSLKSTNREVEQLEISLQNVLREIEENSNFENTNLDIDKLNEELETEEELGSLAASELHELQNSRDNLQEEVDASMQRLTTLKPQFAVVKERYIYLERLIDSQEHENHALDKKTTKLLAEKAGVSLKIEMINQVSSSLNSLLDSFRAKSHLFDFDSPENDERMSSLFTRLTSMRDDLSEKNASKDACFEKISSTKIDLTKTDMSLESATERIEANFDGEFMQALTLPSVEDRESLEVRATELNTKMSKLGSIDLSARADYEALQERFDFMNSNLLDIKVSIQAIEKIDVLIEKRFKEQFEKTFECVNENFKSTFTELFPGGFGELSLTNPDNLDESGVMISANPAGKKIRKISLLSGGEKSLVALSFLFALYNTRKTPFYILDEVEAALDDTNLVRMLSYIDNMREETQFIFITHQRRTMEMADLLFGVSMQEDGITKVISQKLSAFALDE